jgi:hypothetical protein
VTGKNGQQEIDSSIAGALTYIRNLPLRWSDQDGGNTKASVLARGWFRGAGECARVLVNETKMEAGEGRGFGGGWPILKRGAWMLAPAMPVAVGAGPTVGIDGVYRGDPAGVWREAAGAEDLFLAPDRLRPAPGKPFDLLWFGDTERFLLRGGMLEIEDLFGTLRVPAGQRLLDRLLIRSRRASGGLLNGLPMNDRPGPQTIEVRRPEELSSGDSWRDPSIFLSARADIEWAKPRGTIIETRVVGGEHVIFGFDGDHDGWRVTVQDGRFVFSEARLARRGAALSLCVTLDSEIDALAPGMRGRLIFDLRADLVALG